MYESYKRQSRQWQMTGNYWWWWWAWIITHNSKCITLQLCKGHRTIWPSLEWTTMMRGLYNNSVHSVASSYLTKSLHKWHAYNTWGGNMSHTIFCHLSALLLLTYLTGHWRLRGAAAIRYLLVGVYLTEDCEIQATGMTNGLPSNAEAFWHFALYFISKSLFLLV